MAGYQSQARGSMNRNTDAQKSVASLRKKIFATGLFAPNKEGVKSIGSVQVKEEIVIPAGSYLNLYEADRKSDTHPVFTLSVTEGSLAKK